MMRYVSNMCMMKRNPVVPSPVTVGTEHSGTLLGYIQTLVLSDFASPFHNQRGRFR